MFRHGPWFVTERRPTYIHPFNKKVMQKTANWIFKNYPTIGRKLQPAEISEGTFQTGAILESIFAHFAPSGYRLPYRLGKALNGCKSFRQWQAGTFDSEQWNEREDGCEEMCSVQDCISGWAAQNDLLLPGHYFGANQGNDSLLGIWWDWSFDEFPAFDEHPEGRQTEMYFVVNERGNVSLHTKNGKEIFSYC